MVTGLWEGHVRFRSKRGYGSPLSILLIDIDGLKRINDERGHAAGNQILPRRQRHQSVITRARPWSAMGW